VSFCLVEVIEKFLGKIRQTKNNDWKKMKEQFLLLILFTNYFMH